MQVGVFLLLMPTLCMSCHFDNSHSNRYDVIESLASSMKNSVWILFRNVSNELTSFNCQIYEHGMSLHLFKDLIFQ